MSDTILLFRDGAIATVILNRPEKLNALTKPMWQRLGEVFEDLSADDAIRCVVIRGAGEHFMAGGDVKKLRKMVKKKPPEGFVGWNEDTFKKLKSASPEPLAQLEAAEIGQPDVEDRERDRRLFERPQRGLG